MSLPVESLMASTSLSESIDTVSAPAIASSSAQRSVSPPLALYKVRGQPAFSSASTFSPRARQPSGGGQAELFASVLDEVRRDPRATTGDAGVPTRATSSTSRTSRASARKHILPLPRSRSNHGVLRDISLSDVVLCERLGKGASGTIISACLVNGWNCAVKIMSLDLSLESEVQSMEKEIKLMRQIPTHPNLLQYLGHVRDANNIALFMTRHTCSLRSLISKMAAEGRYFTPKQVCSIAHQISSGLAALHSHAILHRDLKSDNIFVSLNHENDIVALVIGDFDSAKRCGKSQQRTPRGGAVGTTGWQAPEIEGGDKTLSSNEGVDVFAFGMVIYELITLRIPYHNLLTPSAIRKAVLSGATPTLQADDIERYGPLLISIFRRCISFDHTQRPTASRLEFELSTLVIARELNSAFASFDPDAAADDAKRYARSAPTSPREKRVPLINFSLPATSTDGDDQISPKSVCSDDTAVYSPRIAKRMNAVSRHGTINPFPRSQSSASDLHAARRSPASTPRGAQATATTISREPTTTTATAATTTTTTTTTNTMSPPSSPVRGAPLSLPSSPKRRASPPAGSSSVPSLSFACDERQVRSCSATKPVAKPTGFLAFVDESEMMKLNQMMLAKKKTRPSIQ